MRQIVKLIISMLIISSSTTALATERYETEGGITYFHTEIEDAKKVIFTVYWPHAWPYFEGNNPTAPAVGAKLMLQGGAGEMKPLDILQKFNELNSVGQLVATRYGIVGTLSLGRNDIDAAAALVADILGRPTLDANWMTRIKTNLRKEREKAGKGLEAQGWNAVRYLDLGTQPYRSFIAGDNLANIDNLTLEDVREWHRQTFQKTGVVVSVAGPITPANAGIGIDLMARNMTSGSPATLPTPQINNSIKRIWLHRPEAEKAVIGYTGSIPNNSEGREVEDLIAVNIFGRGENSILFKALRTELRATYGFSAGTSAYSRNIKFVWFSGEVEPAMVSKVDIVIREAYSKFISERPNKNHFNALRNNIAAAIARNRKLAPVAANMALDNMLDGFKVGRLDTIIEDVRAIKVEDVYNHLSKSYPKSDQLVQFVVSPNFPESVGFCVISNPIEALDCK